MTTRPLSTKQRNPRRVRMVEAALRLIARGGVISVTHRAVAEEAGVPLASTTYYFDSKSELVEEALRLLIDRSTAFVRQHTAVTEPLTISELVDRIVVFADAQISDPDALLSAQYELMLEAGRSDYLRPLAQRWNVVYMDAFLGLVTHAGVPQPHKATAIIVDFVDGALVDYMNSSRDDFIEGYLRPLLTELVDAWCIANAPGRRRRAKTG